MIRRVLWLPVLFLFAFTSLHAQARLLHRRSLSRQDSSDVHVSPDGKTIIFVVTVPTSRAPSESITRAMDIMVRTFAS